TQELKTSYAAYMSPGLRPACIPSPCRGGGHLGMHSTAMKNKTADCWKKP
uniref:Uncharacterized protein n=1 Tax=Paramormyrops kingsleyae TaxID=1676925 RepID=A0A3B3SNC1_9TELE